MYTLRDTIVPLVRKGFRPRANNQSRPTAMETAKKNNNESDTLVL